MTARYRERLTRLEAVLLLENLDIDMQELRASCSYGVPDGLRPLCWRLLLGLLPTERHTWQSFLKHQRDVYEELVQQVIVRPGTQPSANNDHPLSESEGSEWGAYFEDNTVLRQIDKDCRRLCPEIEFFQRCTPYPNPMAAEINLSSRISMDNLPSEEVRVDKFGLSSITRKRASQDYQNAIAKGAETHWQVLERILFIYSKLNPGVKYVQGMNEVIGPIYYVFASDPDREWAAFAEPDTFYCFQLLMSEIKDNFIKTLDTSDCGIEFVMTRFHDLLKKYDPPLHEHLVQELSIKPQFYAFRWLSLLLSQEFPLPDVITVWDSLFSDSKRFDLLQYVGLAMLEGQRDSLLGGDFSHCLRLLQNYPEGDVGQLVMLAMAIRDGKVKLPGAEPDDDKTTRFANMISSTFKSFIKK